jgi:hypothetical protein
VCVCVCVTLPVAKMTDERTNTKHWEGDNRSTRRENYLPNSLPTFANKVINFPIPQKYQMGDHYLSKNDSTPSSSLYIYSEVEKKPHIASIYAE